MTNLSSHGEGRGVTYISGSSGIGSNVLDLMSLLVERRSRKLASSETSLSLSLEEDWRKLQ